MCFFVSVKILLLSDDFACQVSYLVNLLSARLVFINRQENKYFGSLISRALKYANVMWYEAIQGGCQFDPKMVSSGCFDDIPIS